MQQRLWRYPAGVLAALALLAGAAAPAPAAPQPPAGQSVAPAVPGFDRLKDEAKDEPAALGELLLGELNCVACHAAEGAAENRINVRTAPNLADVGARVTPQYLRAYLSDPHKAKPGVVMPDIFHASEPAAKEGAVDFLTHYLASLGGPIKPSTDEGNAILVEQGRNLYHTVGCVACHAPEKKPDDKKAPPVPLGNQAMKTTADQLAAFLLDPHKSRPSGRMPYSNLTKEEARAIAVYLLRDQLDNPQLKDAPPARTKGLKYIFYEVSPRTAAVELVDPLRPKSDGKVEKVTLDVPTRGGRGQNFIIKFTGAVAVPRDGKYTFFLNSDDGSRLYLDGKLVVDNDGTHGPTEKSGTIELKSGDHPIIVTYFQGSGESVLSASWEGPGIEKQEIPAEALFSVGGRAMIPLENNANFKVDPQKAAMGGKMFAAMGCASCHAVEGVQPMRNAKPLAGLNVAEGCLSEHVAKGLPDYNLSTEQREALAAAVKNAAGGGLAQALGPKEHVARSMAAMNCYACHVRDKVGGPTSAREGFFVMTAKFDMGEEGYIPPKLTGVGDKLKPEAMEGILFEGKHHVRGHHMSTRMPRFSREKLPGVADAFAEADAKADAPAEAQKFNEVAARDGRLLVGIKGLGCINCHGVGGNKSLGMPSVDLSTAHDRLRHEWFTELLHDPNSKNPGTRMPGFWLGDIVAIPDVGGGTVNGQIDSIWAYLSLGKSMPLPAGVLVAGKGYELVPTDEPLIHRTFMAEVGPRAVLVGFPDNVHVAFDANTVRLAKAWRGRFFDAKGMWDGRGGQALGPLGTDVINLPPGPAFAVLASPSAAWPVPKDGNDRNVGGKFRGYRLDKNLSPIFRYELNGVTIEEQPLPLLKPGGATLQRKFGLKSGGGEVSGLHFVAAAGSKIEPGGAGEWRVDDKLTVRLTGQGADAAKAAVRDGPGGKQLVIPVTLGNGAAAFDVEMSW